MAILSLTLRDIVILKLNGFVKLFHFAAVKINQTPAFYQLHKIHLFFCNGLPTGSAVNASFINSIHGKSMS